MSKFWFIVEKGHLNSLGLWRGDIMNHIAKGPVLVLAETADLDISPQYAPGK
jgi:hypothetical protein